VCVCVCVLPEKDECVCVCFSELGMSSYTLEELGSSKAAGVEAGGGGALLPVSEPPSWSDFSVLGDFEGLVASIERELRRASAFPPAGSPLPPASQLLHSSAVLQSAAGAQYRMTLLRPPLAAGAPSPPHLLAAQALALVSPGPPRGLLPPRCGGAAAGDAVAALALRAALGTPGSLLLLRSAHSEGALRDLLGRVGRDDTRALLSAARLAAANAGLAGLAVLAQAEEPSAAAFLGSAWCEAAGVRRALRVAGAPAWLDGAAGEAGSYSALGSADGLIALFARRLADPGALLRGCAPPWPAPGALLAAQLRALRARGAAARVWRFPAGAVASAGGALVGRPPRPVFSVAILALHDGAPPLCDEAGPPVPPPRTHLLEPSEEDFLGAPWVALRLGAWAGGEGGGGEEEEEGGAWWGASRVLAPPLHVLPPPLGGCGGAEGPHAPAPPPHPLPLQLLLREGALAGGGGAHPASACLAPLLAALRGAVGAGEGEEGGEGEGGAGSAAALGAAALAVLAAAPPPPAPPPPPPAAGAAGALLATLGELLRAPDDEDGVEGGTTAAAAGSAAAALARPPAAALLARCVSRGAVDAAARSVARGGVPPEGALAALAAAASTLACDAFRSGEGRALLLDAGAGGGGGEAAAEALALHAVCAVWAAFLSEVRGAWAGAGGGAGGAGAPPRVAAESLRAAGRGGGASRCAARGGGDAPPLPVEETFSVLRACFPAPPSEDGGGAAACAPPFNPRLAPAPPTTRTHALLALRDCARMGLTVARAAAGAGLPPMRGGGTGAWVARARPIRAHPSPAAAASDLGAYKAAAPGGGSLGGFLRWYFGWPGEGAAGGGAEEEGGGGEAGAEDEGGGGEAGAEDEGGGGEAGAEEGGWASLWANTPAASASDPPLFHPRACAAGALLELEALPAPLLLAQLLCVGGGDALARAAADAEASTGALAPRLRAAFSALHVRAAALRSAVDGLALGCAAADGAAFASAAEGPIPGGNTGCEGAGCPPPRPRAPACAEAAAARSRHVAAALRLEARGTVGALCSGVVDAEAARARYEALRALLRAAAGEGAWAESAAALDAAAAAAAAAVAAPPLASAPPPPCAAALLLARGAASAMGGDAPHGAALAPQLALQQPWALVAGGAARAALLRLLRALGGGEGGAPPMPHAAALVLESALPRSLLPQPEGAAQPPQRPRHTLAALAAPPRAGVPSSLVLALSLEEQE
jgi:hypothetical protein